MKGEVYRRGRGFNFYRPPGIVFPVPLDNWDVAIYDAITRPPPRELHSDAISSHRRIYLIETLVFFNFIYPSPFHLFISFHKPRKKNFNYAEKIRKGKDDNDDRHAYTIKIIHQL